MATTDARAGFRLPWSSDRQSDENPDGDPSASTVASTEWPSDDAALPAADVATATATVDAPPAAAPAEAPVTRAGPSPAPSAPSAAPAPKPGPARKPSKFMADLTKAMQAAAEDARTRTLGQLQADAKTHVETIHGRSATEAANLRRNADDDVASVREWSKEEIARVRAETETKITARKGRLESEIEDHAAVIEREIDTVQKTVAAFEEEMTAFFERLLGEDDPSRFATMAENLPEPPIFDGFEGEADADAELESPAEAVVETLETVAEEAESVAAEAVASPIEEPVAADTDTIAQGSVETTAAETGSAAVSAEAGDDVIDRESAFAAIQAAAEAAASAEVAADAAARAEAVADVAIEIMGSHEDAEDEVDPRFAALNLSPDYDAAEAEALADAGSSDEEIPVIGDDALAARLAGLVPNKDTSKGDATASTQVVVVGLVSVASIASFKRHLGRLAGVQSVGVSSGPEGEFIFAVNHNPDVVLRDAIPSLPSFQSRVTGSSDGVVHVTAHDPESDS